eukprot:TRINITY_DN98_c0_g1_i1.p1 TRINITY_DN98_c0_g1~~TRINITY_DN98_c0_g1_i1.p1  ORF type:complete len:409 (-),score=98.69 TRINITY_DN98_c0_g1_i1:136-1362(-)
MAMKLFCLISALLIFGEAANWGGVNNFFIHTLPDQSRHNMLDQIQAAGLKVIRIFIGTTYAGTKGSDSLGSTDPEQWEVGNYDDSILNTIDQFMLDCFERGIKLNIVLHDRYALGCWGADAYVKKYNLPNTAPNCNTKVNQPWNFYWNQNAQADIDRRLVHILTHRNPHFNNRPWGSLSEVVFAFAPENEAQGWMNNPNPNWTCGRVNAMRPYVTNGTLIITGGGVTWEASLLSEFFDCKNLDVVSVHDYDLSTSGWYSNMENGRNLAWNSGKRLIVEEFGSTGNVGTKSSNIPPIIDTVNGLGIPVMPWEFVNPANDNDFEFYNEDPLWFSISCRAKQALSTKGAFDWPEIDTRGANSTACQGGGGNLPNWAFCSASWQCQCGCCSNQYSNDGKYKCTPGGSANRCI